MMDSDEFENEGQEAAPIDMLAAYFEAHGWSFEHAGEDEIVANTQGSWAQYELRAIWREEDQVLQLLVLPDIRVTDEKRPAIYETIGLINEQLWLGHFELWSSSGIVLFRHGALLGPSEAMTLDQAQILVETALDECERFYPVFQFVLWGGKSPAEAISASLIETRGEA
ncbi:MAG: hypothetical protein DI547_14515 [Sphingobium sp.]|nr:MAG: hypothetical protein DI547_14515 [Sphingobium sp.]